MFVPYPLELGSKVYGFYQNRDIVCCSCSNLIGGPDDNNEELWIKTFPSIQVFFQNKLQRHLLIVYHLPFPKLKHSDFKNSLNLEFVTSILGTEENSKEHMLLSLSIFEFKRKQGFWFHLLDFLIGFLLMKPVLKIPNVLDLAEKVALHFNVSFTMFVSTIFKTAANLWENHMIYFEVPCFLGAFTCFGLMHDLFLIFNLHFLLFFLISKHHLEYLARFISSFALLFMGRKRNPLRSRVDHAEFSVDQLLLGTIILCLLLHLLPTLIVFCFFLSFFYLVPLCFRKFIWFVMYPPKKFQLYPCKDYYVLKYGI